MNCTVETNPEVPKTSPPPAHNEGPGDAHELHNAYTGLLVNAATILARFLEADFGGLSELDPAGERMRTILSPARPGEASPVPLVHETSLEATGSLAACTLKHNSPVLVADLIQESRFRDGFLRNQGVISALGVPLQQAHQPIGTLCVCRTEERDFSLDDVRFAQSIAQSLVTLLTRFQAEESMRGQGVDESGQSIFEATAERTTDIIEGDSEQEARSSPRQVFKHVQQIAPMHGSVLPDSREFFDVECIDISGNGVAFYLDNPPSFESLVVALGNEPDRSFFSARIVNIREIRRNGRTAYRAGCLLQGRVII